MPGAITIRPGRAEECPTVLEVWQRAEATPSATDSLTELRRLVGEPQAQLLVAVDAKGRIVGTAIAGWDGWRAGIYRLAVVPEARRRGVARALVEAGERWLAARGARRMSVLVERHDPAAVAFWDALGAAGYRRDPHMMRYVKAL
jgi:ribosomal protein S18 acetylase RimI-like enzyme